MCIRDRIYEWKYPIQESHRAISTPLQVSVPLSIYPVSYTHLEMLGSWVLAPEPKRTVTFLEGLEERYGKQNIYFAPGCRIQDVYKRQETLRETIRRNIQNVFFRA